MFAQDPQRQFGELKDKLLEQIDKTFPIRDREDAKARYEVRVKDLVVEDTLGTDDIKGQFKARVEGRSWAVPVKGTVEVVDLTTGKPVIRKEGLQIAKIPKLTRHYSYIVGGQEKFIANQWRLRPGPYVKATERRGEHEAQFQLAKGRPFDIQMDPKAGHLFMKVGQRKIPLYSVLKAHGVSDDEMRRAWGDDSYKASKERSDYEKDLKSLYRAWRKTDPEPDQDLVTETRAIFDGTEMDPVVAKANLGVDSSKVTPEVLLRASKKLVDVSAGRAEPDPIDSLKYKGLWTSADQLVSRLALGADDIKTRVQKSLRRPTIQKRLVKGDAGVLRDVVMPDLIQRPLYYAFTTPLAGTGSQLNPVAMLSDRSHATITGPGGIQNRYQISESNTAIDPSQLGFLDPVFTPESDPGVTTHLTAGVKIKNRKPYIRLYNMRTKRFEDVDAATATSSNVVLPDQVWWRDGKPVPIGKSVRVSDSKGQIRDDLPWNKAQYVIPSPAQLFSVETNLVPFMQNDSAGRTTMSARHMAQAISITGREPPMVQVEAGAGRTFEELVGGGFLSHRAPVSGRVKEVKNDEIIVEDAKGKTHSVHIYDNYPLNHEKARIHSTPMVKPGDRVEKGQILADNNYTKDGKLALGTNLRVAYLANGSNHEDGIVISESARQKLTSEHMLKPSLMVTKDHVVGKSVFVNQKSGKFTMEQLKKIGDDGVVAVGMRVKPGDPLILALAESKKPTTIDAKTQRRLGKRLRSRYNDATLTWDHDYEGEVVRVVRSGKNIVVHVKTVEPVQIGSKLSTRHSAKGIVTAILPDEEMPRDAKGRPVQMLINPVSVPGRMNPGQILETAAGKIAEKTGKPYKIRNFETGTDYLKKVQQDLKKHKLKDTEPLYDPKTGRKLGDVTVGPHYVFQLEHQIDKKTHVRSGGPSFGGAPKLYYDPDTHIPRGGGKHGAQSLGALGIYGALASGLKDNLREMQTLKSDMDQATEVWGAITNGERLPPPRVPFAYKKFEHMLHGLGLNLEKKGTEIRIIPRTDAETRAMSSGELKKASRLIRVKAKGEQPEKGGLFDPEKTGGEEGTKWSHIELVEPLPHPIYSKAIALTLGLSAQQPDKQLAEVLQGTKKLPNGQTGPKAIIEALKKIDVKKEMASVKKALDNPNVKGSELDKLNFRYKALKLLDESGKHPKDAWTIKAVPVLPPIYRPAFTMPDGRLRNHPLNSLYRRVAMVNETLKRGEGKVPYNTNLDVRAGLFQELQNLFGTTPKGKKAKELDMRGTREDPDKQLPGILHMVAGEKPKDGYFQDKLIGKKQDYTARATIVVDPNLPADELGVPKKIALELMRPMVARRLTSVYGDPEKAHELITKKDPVALRALQREVEERPVLMKRDPVLHQYGIVGQKVRLTDSPAIAVSPLVLPPIGGDIDGDTVALMVPLSREAVDEVKKILPSQRPMSDSSGDVLYRPTNEASLSLYRMSIPRGNKRGMKFSKIEDAERAFQQNKINLNDVINIGGTQTTLGRARIAKVVPDRYRKDILTDLKKPFDKKFQEKILTELAKEKPKDFMEVTDNLSRLGFKMAYESGHTVTLKDLEPLRQQRAQIIEKTKKRVRTLRQDEDIAKEWRAATKKLHEAYERAYKRNPTNVSDMAAAGIKAKREQFQGLVMAPMLVEDFEGRPSKVPITRSFAEGLDTGGYFLQAQGARRGLRLKTQATSEPGYMSKMLVQINIDQPISGKDCGTDQGIALSIGDKDVIDRFLAKPVKVNGRTLPAGTVVTPDILSDLKAKKVDKLFVRSPLKCRMPHGVCSRCMGVHPTGKDYEPGEHAGIIAAQALGERASQLMLKRTHAGGIVGIKDEPDGDFSDVRRLFNVAKPSPLNAALSTRSGHVTRIDRTKDGRWQIFVRDDKKGTLKAFQSRQKPLPHIKPSAPVKKGDALTEGEPNPWDILRTQGLEAMQHHMTKRIGDIYGREGVLRRHVELTVRNATGLMRITDPGDHDSYIKGDYVMKPVIDELNRTVLRGKRPIRATPALSAINMNPLYRQKDWMGRLQSERLREQLMISAQHGERTDIQGRHPIPGLAFGARFGLPKET